MPQEMNFEDAQAAPGHVASTDGLGPLVEAAMIAADEYGEAAFHAECWTGTRTAYNEHLAAARAKVESAVVAAVVAERERCADECRKMADSLAEASPLDGSRAAVAIELERRVRGA